MTSYLGFDVLLAPPNTRDDVQETFRRSIAQNDPGLGLVDRWTRDTAPQLDRSYLWTCTTRSEIAQLKAWLDARCGQAIPFWIPTGRRDLLLAAPIGADATTFVVLNTGYTQFAFPHKARRHVAFLTADPLLRAITSASDLGATEQLGLSSALGVLVPASALVSNLVLCRLATDAPTITYHSDSKAECTLAYVEIPEETP